MVKGCFKRNTCFNVPPIDCPTGVEEDPATEAKEDDALMALFLRSFLLHWKWLPQG